MMDVGTSLPLRLGAEPFVRRAIKHSFLLPSKSEERLCLVIAESGIVAVVTATWCDSDEIRALVNTTGTGTNTAADSSDIPRVQFAFDTKTWHDMSPSHGPLVGGRSIIVDERDVARLVTITVTEGNSSTLQVESWHCQPVIDGIFRYYSRQVLEPSIRGFLSILEKTFPRNDLYLFELLQNSVDDGAMNVSFTSKSGGLFFMHDGRPFNPMDCLGLSSVGLSTKGSDGNKRTIGFMGIGFKAVYKRFAKVTIYDKHWSFAFDEPTNPAPLEPSHGWVLKSKWISDKSSLWDSNPTSPTLRWCHFQLERPRGGSSSVLEDLKYLPTTIPPLLGRQALANHALSHGDRGRAEAGAVETASVGATWTLEWSQSTHQVRVLKSTTAGGTEGTGGGALLCAGYKDATNNRLTTFSLSSETVQVIQTDKLQSQALRMSSGNSNGSIRTKARHWQFITLKFTPNTAAQEAYEVHTKRAWSSPTGEETSLFFEVDESGAPIISTGTGHGDQRGHIHAVLPTKLKLPTALQWQASWLLSIDRQEVQNITDNVWNHYMIKQAPKLLAGLLLWSARANTFKTVSALNAVYALLPPMTITQEQVEVSSIAVTKGYHRGSNHNNQQPKTHYTTKYSLGLTLFGVSISLEEAIEIIRDHAVVPTITEAAILATVVYSDLHFLKPAQAMWLPPSFTRRLPIPLLTTWFGVRPMCTHLLNLKSSFLQLWKLLMVRPSEQSLAARVRVLEIEIESLSSSPSVSTPAAPTTTSGDRCLGGLPLLIQLLAAVGESLMLVVPDEASVNASGDGLATSAKQQQTGQKWPNKPSIETVLPTSFELCNDWLPALQHWPVFMCEDRRLRAPSAVTFWLSPDFDTIPADIRGYLLNGIRWRNERATLLHHDLIEIFSPDFAVGGSVVDQPSVLLARQALVAARQYATTHVSSTKLVSLEQATNWLFEFWGELELNRKAELKLNVDVCLRIFNWAMKAGKPQVVTHLLVGSPTNRLIKASYAYLGQNYLGQDGSLIEALFQQPSSDSTAVGSISTFKRPSTNSVTVSFVSSIYLPHSEMSTRELKPFVEFMVACGALSGISLSGKSRIIHSKSPEILLLEDKALPKLRSTNPSCDIYLPYGLGALTRKDYICVDAAFSSEWQSLLSQLSSNTDKAQTFSSLVSKILSHSLDIAAQATPETTPAAAQALSGKPAITGDGRELGTSTHRVDTRSRVPAVARLFYLPPGQPGAATANVGVAEWLKALAQSKWVPAAPPGASPEAPPTLVLRPCEVALPDAVAGSRTAMSSSSAGGSSSQLAYSAQLRDEMPTIRLPASTVQLLRNCPPLVLDCLKWGTVKPAPPLKRLEELAALTTASTEEENDRYYFDELVSIWRALVVAYLDQRLTPSDCTLIRTIVYGNNEKARVIPGLQRLWSGRYCFQSGTSTSSGDDDVVVGLLLCRAKFALNISLFDCDPDWELAGVAGVMVSILQPPKAPSKAVAEEFLHWCCATNPTPFTHPLAWSAIRHGFSCAMWSLVKRHFAPNVLTQSGNSTAMDGPSNLALGFLKKTFPNLRIYCVRGPGISQHAFPAGWVDVWPTATTSGISGISPLLIDDLDRSSLTTGAGSSGILKSTLLEPKHHYQPIGLLNHGFSTPGPNSSNERDDFSSFPFLDSHKVQAMDQRLLDVLKIPRISDGKVFSLKIISTKSPTLLAEAIPRLEIVMLLVQKIISASNSTGGHGDCEIKLPPLFRHKHLAIHFKSPKMQEPEVRSIYSLWGSVPPAPQGSTQDWPAGHNYHLSRALFIAEQPDDYATELEDLIFTYVCDCLHIKRSAGNVTKPVKALRLLQYLEDDQKFLKHINRSFDGFFSAKSAALKAGPTLPDDSASESEDLESTAETVDRRLNILLERIKPPPPPPPPPPIAADTFYPNEDRYGGSLATKRRLDVDAQPLNDAPPPPQLQRTATSDTNDRSLIAVENIQSAEAFLSEIVSVLPHPTSASCAPAPRGISNLPAWMTNPNLVQSAAGIAPIESSNPTDKVLSEPPKDPANKYDIGRSIPGPTQSAEPSNTQIFTSSSLPAEVNCSGSSGTSTAASAATAAAAAAVTSNARMARLGISNLPSWMTHGSLNPTETEAPAICEGATKRKAGEIEPGEEPETPLITTANSSATMLATGKKRRNDVCDELLSFFFRVPHISPRHRSDLAKMQDTQARFRKLLKAHSDHVVSSFVELLGSNEELKILTLELLDMCEERFPLVQDMLSENK